MTEYRMLGPDECPDYRFGDEVRSPFGGNWVATHASGRIQAKYGL